ncbi:MAG: ribosome biogenesis GTP-binding protein YihA/YsxC [Bacteroidia bacterium]
MEVQLAKFLKSYGEYVQMQQDLKPEFAFIGRSNVGKSSLINMLCNNKYLAKTSSTPGKTKLINQFLINEKWYLVDLPGYGYARASKGDKKQFDSLITNYIVKRENLYCLFVLIDSRLEPQKIDVEFINKCGSSGIPICLIYTKIDKDKGKAVKNSVEALSNELKKTWENLPTYFLSSAEKGDGRKEILDYINKALKQV